MIFSKILARRNLLTLAGAVVSSPVLAARNDAGGALSTEQKASVAELLALANWSVETPDRSAFLSCFAENAQISFDDRKYSGHVELGGWFTGAAAEWSGCSLLTSDLLVRKSGSVVSAMSHLTLLSRVSVARPRSTPSLVWHAQTEDEITFKGSKPVFTVRRFTGIAQTPKPW